MFFTVLKKDIDNYFDKEQDYEKDIGDFYLYLKENVATTTLRGYISALKQFLATFDKNTKQLDIWITISARTRGEKKYYEDGELDPLQQN